MAFHHTAQGLAALGRNGDDTLLHVNKHELAGLQALLGPVTVNPETGMPEAFQWWELAAAGLAGALTMGAGSLLAGALEGGVAAADTAAVADTAATAGTTAEGGTGLIGGGASTGGGAISGGAELAPGAIGSGGASSTPEQLAAAKEAISAPVELPPAQNPMGTDALTRDAAQALAKGTGAPNVTAGAPGTPPAGPTPSVDAAWQQAGKSAMSNIGQGGTQAAQGPQGFMEGAQQGMAKSASAWTNPENYSFANAAKYGPMAMTIGGAEVSAAEAPGQRRAAQKQAQGTADMWNQQISNNMGALGYRGDPGQFFVGQGGVLQGTTPKIFTGGFGMAEGGLAALGNVGGTPVQVQVPEQYTDTVEQGVRSLGGPQGFANGGYANTQPFNPQQFYPQSQIRSAQPYGAAAGTRVLDTLSQGASFNRGGYAKGQFLDGPGDGMSDDIPANIDGAEPVKLADGEFIIPADVVSILGNGSSKAGAKVLHEGLAAIRQAGTGNTNQVKQDAGRMAFERVVKKAGKKRAHSKRTA